MKKLTIAEARRVAEKFGADSAVILLFDADRFAGASYGATKAKCAIAGEWLDDLCCIIGDGFYPGSQHDGPPKAGPVRS